MNTVRIALMVIDFLNGQKIDGNRLSVKPEEY
jgi:hypothetical protein